MRLGLNTFRFFKIEFRGAKVSEEEKKQLNESAGKILREAVLDFEMWIDYDLMKEEDYVGYADYYLGECISIDKEVYSKLVELDTRLGTTASEQLYWCLQKTSRSDIIKVRIFLRMQDL